MNDFCSAVSLRDRRTETDNESEKQRQREMQRYRYRYASQTDNEREEQRETERNKERNRERQAEREGGLPRLAKNMRLWPPVVHRSGTWVAATLGRRSPVSPRCLF